MFPERGRADLYRETTAAISNSLALLSVLSLYVVPGLFLCSASSKGLPFFEKEKNNPFIYETCISAFHLSIVNW